MQAVPQQSGKVTYEIQSIDFTPKVKNPEIELIIENAKKQTFTLTFNNKISSEFIQGYILSSGNSQVNDLYGKLASLRFTCDFNYYMDNLNNIEYFKKNNGALIKSEIKDKNWEITTETKTIDNYKCYKAIYKYEYQARDLKTKTRIITAWFTPALPFRYGPKNYNGLPGLILELQDWNTTFLATKIELFDKKIQIDFPNGKTISMDEYEKKSSLEN